MTVSSHSRARAALLVTAFIAFTSGHSVSADRSPTQSPTPSPTIDVPSLEDVFATLDPKAIPQNTAGPLESATGVQSTTTGLAESTASAASLTASQAVSSTALAVVDSSTASVAQHQDPYSTGASIPPDGSNQDATNQVNPDDRPSHDSTQSPDEDRPSFDRGPKSPFHLRQPPADDSHSEDTPAAPAEPAPAAPSVDSSTTPIPVSLSSTGSFDFNPSTGGQESDDNSTLIIPDSLIPSVELLPSSTASSTGLNDDIDPTIIMPDATGSDMFHSSETQPSAIFDRTISFTQSKPLSSSIGSFKTTTHPMPPSAFYSDELKSHGALPTNAWFQNALLEQGDQPIVPLPYTLSAKPDGIQMALPIKKATKDLVIASHQPDMMISSVSAVSEKHRVMAYDEFSVHIRFGSSTAKNRLSGGERISVHNRHLHGITAAIQDNSRHSSTEWSLEFSG